MDQKIRETFEKYLREWQKYLSSSEVGLSSDFRRFVNCEAYRQIKNLGVEALPLIRETYDKRGDFSLDILKLHGLVSLVCEITSPDFQIPEEMRGKMLDIQAYTVKWLDENSGRYRTDA